MYVTMLQKNPMETMSFFLSLSFKYIDKNFIPNTTDKMNNINHMVVMKSRDKPSSLRGIYFRKGTLLLSQILNMISCIHHIRFRVVCKVNMNEFILISKYPAVNGEDRRAIQDIFEFK